MVLLEGSEVKGLGSIAGCVGRIGMDFNDQAVGTGCHGGGGHAWHEVRVPRAMAGVNHNRQVGPRLQPRHRWPAAA